jgi:protein TonB
MGTLVRSLLAVLGALAVVFGLFYLMQSLIALDRIELTDAKAMRVADFVRLRREDQVEEKKRELPQKRTTPEAPPQPALKTPSGPAGGGAAQHAIKLEAPQPVLEQHAVRLSGGPQLGRAPADGGVIPLVRIQPIYPRDAAEKRLEGWVRMEFSIDAKGAVRNAKVIGAQPPGVFDRAAIQALRKWKYKPKIENGVPVEQHGIQVQLTFKLDET